MNRKPFIFDYKNFNNENLILRTPETRNNNIIIPIKYNQTNNQTNNQLNNQLNPRLKLTPLLFKTPKIYMPFKPNITNNHGGYVRLSFDNLKLDPNLKIFYDFINNIDDYLQNEIINSNIINIKNKNNLNFKRTIKKADYFPDYFNLNFNTNDIRVFDTDLNNISIENVDGNFYAYYVIELIGFYYNKKIKQFKLIWNLVQFKLDKTKKIIDECLFLDEEEEINHNNKESEQNISLPKELLKNNIILEKFFKMLIVGIPKPAIQHKMMLSGIEPKFIDYPPDTDIDTLSLEMQNKITTPIDKPKTNNLLNGMLNKLQLKKIIPDQKSKSQIEIEKKDLRVPSLLEIQEARKKLFEKSKKEDKNT